MVLRFLFYILPIILCCIPSIEISEDVKIQGYDIYFIMIGIIMIFQKKKYFNLNIRRISKYWKWFIFSVFISLFIATIRNQDYLFSAYLKFFRLTYPLIFIHFFTGKLNRIDERRVVYILMISSIICSLLGFIGYYYQLDIFSAKEMMDIGSVVYRAGSVFQEADAFGLVSAIFFFICLNYLLSKKRQTHNKIPVILSIVGIAFTTISIFISYSRSSALALLLGTLYILFTNKRKIAIKLILIIIIIYICLYIINAYCNIPEIQTVIDRMSILLQLNSNNVNDVSSGRTERWMWLLKTFYDTPDASILLFGNGYKVSSSKLWSLCDNGYLYTLISSGIISFILFMLYIINLFKVLKRQSGNDMILMNIKAIYICYIIVNCFIDVYTITAVNCLLFYMILIYYSKTKDCIVTVK